MMHLMFLNIKFIHFCHLWQSVKPSGIYVIEDLETKYWRDGDIIYDYKLKSTKIIVAKNAQAVSTAQANPVGASVASNWGQKLDSYALQ